MMGMTPEDWGTIGAIAGILGTLIALIGTPFLVLAWRNHLIDEMTKNPMARERLGQALQAANLVTLYRRSLERGLDKLDGWMGGYAELGRGYGWCLAVAMGYAAAFVFLPWLLYGHGTGFGDLVLLPDADASRPWWVRAGAMLALVLLARHRRLGAAQQRADR